MTDAAFEWLWEVVDHATLGSVLAVVLLLQVVTLAEVAPDTLDRHADVAWVAAGAVVAYILRPYVTPILEAVILRIARYAESWYAGGETA